MTAYKGQSWGLSTIPAEGEPYPAAIAPVISVLEDGSAYVQPASAFGAAPGSVDDAVLINQALAQYSLVRLAPGTFHTQTTIAPPWPASLQGYPWRTMISYSGNGAAVLVQDTFQPPAGTFGLRHQISPTIHGLVIDGTNAAANAIGLNIVDMSGGCDLAVQVNNFTGASAAGCQIANNLYSSNSISGRLACQNCTTGLLFSQIGSEGAIERVDLRVLCEIETGQTGIALAGGIGLYQSRGSWHVLVQQNTVAAIALGASSVLQQCDLLIRGEFGSGQSPGAATTMTFGSGAAVKNCRGSMAWGTNFQPSTIGSQVFEWDGDIIGDANLLATATAAQYQGFGQTTVTAPAVPASGTAASNNTGVGCLVYITAGSLTGATAVANAAGTSKTQGSTGPFYVSTGGTITLTYASAPTWHWIPVGG